MATAAKKWRDFKVLLKKNLFDPTLSDEELIARRQERVNDDDWEWLINYWRSGKSKNELQEAATIFPELKDRTIQEGDLYSSVLGEKEPRGCVRGLGLGPTPQDIGTLGARSYVPARFQMAIVGQQQSAQEVVALKGRVDHMQQEIDVLKQMRGNIQSSSLQPCLGEEQDDHHDNADIGLSAENIPINDDQRTVLNRQAALPRASTRINASPPNNHAAHRPDSSSQVGRDVKLYSTVAPATPVAKATIVSTNPTNIVGGESLGQQYYEVVINASQEDFP
ncbi:hypothetical protein E2562_038077 [Oryza meyeriana var. granulata]|uniref:Transposase Tnp1/En/Spm-like domain-containing protein n=1 Tax=Oryza meyeriana var. granulata TaxID=110450 RepID=A0A6G1DA01_9ORYZ|nr:hypothetical protein E2562_038077 [Oryza meyeriana var. granulata]